MLDFARALKVPVRTPGRRGARRCAQASRSRRPTTSWASRGPIAYWSAERVLEHLRELPGGVSEFMTHPGYFDDDLAYSRYGQQREVEVAGLTDPRARRARSGVLGIRLAHFGQL